MNRCAVFIDAGYVLMAGGLLSLNIPTRSEIGCDVEGLIGDIVSHAETESKLPILRTYWYDGSWGAVPTFEQALIAGLPNVKVRLGRLGYIRGALVQKGVDTLLVSDLMKLAQGRAMSSAFLVTGDEDTRPGLIAAQNQGVRVTLVGIKGRTTGEFNQAETLMSESDGVITLDDAAIGRYFIRRSPLPYAIDSTDVATAASPSTDGEQIGHSFGLLWAPNLTASEARLLVRMRPRIPKPVDGMLMQTCRPLKPIAHDRKTWAEGLRKGFWTGVVSSLAPGP